MKNLSAYTISKNCTDLTDIEVGLQEIRQYFNQCDRQNKKIPSSAFIRLYKLSEAQRKYKGF